MLVIRRWFISIAFPYGEKAGCRYAGRIKRRGPFFCNNVSRNLFPQKFIVGLIRVEGADDPVTIFDRFTNRVIGTITGGVGVRYKPLLATSFRNCISDPKGDSLSGAFSIGAELLKS